MVFPTNPGVGWTAAVLVPLVAWRMYVRVRRMVGRQRMSRVRSWITLVAFPLLIALLAMTAFAPPHPRPERLGWLAAGLAAGALLGVVGLRRTRYEPTPEGLFYTPDARLGIALSVLFVGRVLWRLVQLAISGPVPAGEANDFALSPFTLAPVGMFAGYYVMHAAGLLRWRSRVLRARRERECNREEEGQAAPGP